MSIEVYLYRWTKSCQPNDEERTIILKVSIAASVVH